MSAKIDFLDGNDPHFMSLHIIEIQLENGFGDKSKYLRIAEDLFGAALKDCRNHYVIIHAHNIVLALLKSLKKPDVEIKAHRLRLAHYYISFAESEVNRDRPAIGVVHWYQQAIPILRECKDEATLIDVRKKMEAIQAKISGQMQSFTRSVDISDLGKRIEDSLTGKTISESIYFLITNISFHKKMDLQAQVINPQNRGITDLFPRVIIDRDGKTVFPLPSLNLQNPLEDREALEINMHYRAMKDNQFQGGLLWRTIAFIRSQHTLAIEDLDFIFENNYIVPDGRESVIRQGLFLGLTGEFYTALHLLAPQIENIFRNIAHACGDIVTTYEDKDGSEQAKVLSSIFDLPNLVDCYDEDILFAFKGLLNEKAGGNLRNLIGHGIMEPDEASCGHVIYFICLCLKVLALHQRRIGQYVYRRFKEMQCFAFALGWQGKRIALIAAAGLAFEVASSTAQGSIARCTSFVRADKHAIGVVGALIKPSALDAMLQYGPVNSARLQVGQGAVIVRCCGRQEQGFLRRWFRWA